MLRAEIESLSVDRGWTIASSSYTLVRRERESKCTREGGREGEREGGKEGRAGGRAG